MPRICMRRVVFEHGGRGPFATPFDLDLEPGWTGVVGPNGVGKTTLLRLIAGELACTSGSIRLCKAPAGPRVLAQTVDWTPTLAAELERFAHDWSARAGRLRSRLQLDPEALGRWPTLSPGERKRWQLGAALADEPPILLCDEPGNHLDARARALLIETLQELDGVGLIISHERELLDALCDAIVFIDPGGRIERRPGNYAAASAQREADHAHRRTEFEQARRAERRLASQVQAAREQQAKTERSRRSSSRKRDHRDHDASSMARKYRADRAATSASAGLRRTQSSHARARAAVEGFEIDHRHFGELFVDWAPPRKSTLLSLTPAELAEYAPHPFTRLPEDRAVTIERDTRVHVAGDNGSGKTSLLRALVARARASLGEERILWMPQELDADARRALLELFRGSGPSRARVLQIFAAAGGDPDALACTPIPSPGEARKLCLALGLARRAWLLVLDEPTNHLDLPAREAHERMLRAYPGALLISSHDRRFAEELTNTCWTL
ncbi:MAG: ATP-binding cassette domain-containing protein [Enhygromyxa sp.]